MKIFEKDHMQNPTHYMTDWVCLDGSTKKDVEVWMQWSYANNIANCKIYHIKYADGTEKFW